jgi:Carboxypeptidase regulatory-like domain
MMSGALRRARTAALALGVWGMLAGGAAGQGLTGSIDGTLKDQTSAVLPGVSVTIASPSLIGGPQVRVTEADGTFRFTVLPPGTYAVTFELAGFQKVERPGIVVQPDRTATLDTVLRTATVAEEVTVTGTTPLVDVRNTQIATTVDQAMIQEVPVARRFTDLVNVMPGVQNGLYTFSPVNAVNGSAVTDNVYSVDGLNFVDPQVSSAVTDVAYDDVQEVQVSTSGQSAEFGTASGGVFNFIMKSGSNRFRGLASGYVQTKGLTSNNVDTALASQGITPTFFDHVYDGGGNIGGPIMRDRLWFFGSYYKFDQQQTITDFPVPIPTKQWQASVKFDGRLNEKNRLSFSYSYRDRYWFPFNFGFTTAGDPKTWIAIGWHNPLTNASWTATPDAKTFIEVRGGTANFDLINSEPNAVPGTPVYVETSTGVITGGATQTAGLAVRNRFEIKGDVARFAGNLFGGSHQFKTGVAWERLPLDTEGRDQGHFNDTRLQLLNGNPFRVQLLNIEGHLLTKTEHAAWFLQDQYAIGRFTINAGLRFDHWTGGVGPDHLTGGTWFQPADYPAQNGIIASNNFAPRVGVAWDPTGSRKWVIKAGYGRFYQRVDGVTFSFARQAANGTLTYAWIDRNNDRLYQTGEAGALVSDTRPVAPGKVDPNLKMPYTDAYNFSLERELGGGFGLTVNGIFKRERDLWSRVDLNKPFDTGYTPVPVINPLTNETMTIYSILPSFQATPPNQVLTNPDFAGKLYRNYDGLEFIVKKPMTSHWMTQFSYDLGRSHGTVGTLFFDHQGSPYLNPNNLINNDGDQQLDRRHIAHVLALYRMPYGIQASGHFQFLSGMPLATTFSGGAGVTGATFARFLATQYPLIRSNAFIDVPVQAQGTLRTDSVKTFDFRIDKHTNLGGARSFDVMLDVFNVFNDNTIVRVQSLNRALTNFMRPAEITTPRAARIGFRFNF